MASASPLLTKIFVRRKTLNDSVSFQPFLQDDYQYPLFGTTKGKRFAFYLVGILDPKNFSIKQGVPGLVVQLQTIFKTKIEDFFVMVSLNLLYLGYLLKKTLH